jgi:hypothetical protein
MPVDHLAENLLRQVQRWGIAGATERVEQMQGMRHRTVTAVAGRLVHYDIGMMLLHLLHRATAPFHIRLSPQHGDGKIRMRPNFLPAATEIG